MDNHMLESANEPEIRASECKAYFRRRAETRRAENISAQLGSTCHGSALEKENIAVLKQVYWWYLIKNNFEAKENINNSLRN